MPHTRSKVDSANEIFQPYPTPTSAPIVDAEAKLELSGYNYAVDKMHELLGKYPDGERSEMSLVISQGPELNEYIAWKTVSYRALKDKLSEEQTLQVFEGEYGYLNYKEAVDDEIAREEVARTLANMPSASFFSSAPSYLSSSYPSSGYDSFGSLSSGHLNSATTAVTTPRSSLLPSYNAQILSNEPKFPDLDFMPMPEGQDADLVDPRAEDMLHRWNQGGEKADVIIEKSVRDSDGNRVKRLFTGYVVDGKLFQDVGPDFRTAVAGATDNSRPKIKRAKSGLVGRTVTMSMPVGAMLQSKKRSNPNDDSDYVPGGKPQKRARSSSSSEDKLAAMPTPEKRNQRNYKTSNGSASSRKISSSSSGSGTSGINAKDIANLQSILPGQSMHHVMDAFEATGQPVMPAPPLPTNRRGSVKNATAQSTGSPSRMTRRRSRPSPLNLAPPPPSTLSVSRNITPSPSPAVTPQGSLGGTPRRNKYIPTTPNPARWTASELYHLNKLARKGLHPTELHPSMAEEFPHIVRSQHAIKDRRDKMKRAGELVGRMPNYAAKYPDGK